MWGAKNQETGVTYLYDCYKGKSSEPAIHIAAIKARGDWIPGVMDAAALIVTRGDAEQLIHVYQSAGLDVILPDKAVETGVYAVWQGLSTGLIKVFSTCAAWFEEYRLYRRDEKGRIVKVNDHVQDSTRYLILSGMVRAKVQPAKRVEPARSVRMGPDDGLDWMDS